MLSPTILALLVTAGLLVGLTALAGRHRGKPGATSFAVLQAFSAVWAILMAVGLALSPGTLRLRVWGLTTGASLLVALGWLAFVLSYTGRDRWLTPRRFGPLAAPLVAGAGLYILIPGWSPIAGPVIQRTIGAGTVVDSTVGIVGVGLGAYIYVVFLAGLVLIVKTLLEGPRMFVGQALAIGLGSLVTIVASVLVLIGVPTGGYPLTQVMLVGQALLWGYAVFGQAFLRAVPAVAEIGQRAVFDEIDHGVLVVDTDGTVIRANPTARMYLDAAEPVDEQVEALLGLSEKAVPADLPTRLQREGRTYQVKASAIRNWRGNGVGHAVVLQDITLLVRRQQRLEVLNRILRHNVRNDMNVVMMIGDDLRDREEQSLVETGETLYRKADELTTISEKALDIDRAFDRQGAGERVDPAVLVENVVTPLARAYPDATVRTAVTAGAVQTDLRVLSLVLEEVVENALEHAGETPAVHLEISDTNTGIEVSVTDDGPGIPETEYSPVLNGGETALDHASSLGLWVVNWGVQSLGGEVAIDTAGDGSTVTLSVPDMARFDEQTREQTPAESPQLRPSTPDILRGTPDTNI
jgi:signal transduction histidine kinase